MRVLIDTSAWIEFLRRNGDPELKSRVADLVASGRAAYTCPVRFELFTGARKSEQRTLAEALSFAERIPVTAAHWDKAAAHAAALRAMGVTVPASDLLIATVAVENRASLLARDDDFNMIREGVMPGLQLT